MTVPSAPDHIVELIELVEAKKEKSNFDSFAKHIIPMLKEEQERKETIRKEIEAIEQENVDITDILRRINETQEIFDKLANEIRRSADMPRKEHAAVTLFKDIAVWEGGYETYEQEVLGKAKEVKQESLVKQVVDLRSELQKCRETKLKQIEEKEQEILNNPFKGLKGLLEENNSKKLVEYVKTVASENQIRKVKDLEKIDARSEEAHSFLKLTQSALTAIKAQQVLLVDAAFESDSNMDEFNNNLKNALEPMESIRRMEAYETIKIKLKAEESELQAYDASKHINGLNKDLLLDEIKKADKSVLSRIIHYKLYNTQWNEKPLAENYAKDPDILRAIIGKFVEDGVASSNELAVIIPYIADPELIDLVVNLGVKTRQQDQGLNDGSVPDDLFNAAVKNRCTSDKTLAILAPQAMRNFQKRGLDNVKLDEILRHPNIGTHIFNYVSSEKEKSTGQVQIILGQFLENKSNKGPGWIGEGQRNRELNKAKEPVIETPVNEDSQKAKM